MTLLRAAGSALQQSLLLYLVKTMRRRFVFEINTCISQSLSHGDRSKPRVVQADLRLLEMQIARAGAAQGSVETSQGKASVPVAASDHNPGGALAW